MIITYSPGELSIVLDALARAIGASREVEKVPSVDFCIGFVGSELRTRNIFIAPASVSGIVNYVWPLMIWALEYQETGKYPNPSINEKGEWEDTSACIFCQHPIQAHQPICLVMIDEGRACECDPINPCKHENTHRAGEK